MTETIIAQVRAYKTLDDCEADIVAYQFAYERAAQALLEIYERDLYLEASYATFEDYVRDRWQISPGRASQLKAAGEFVRHLSVSGSGLPVPASEAHVRPLMKIRPTPEDREDAVWTRRENAWQMAVDHARNANEPVTARLVESVVTSFYKGGDRVKRKPETPEVTLKDLVEAFRDIADSGVSPEVAVEKWGSSREWEWFNEAADWMRGAQEASE